MSWRSWLAALSSAVGLSDGGGGGACGSRPCTARTPPTSVGAMVRTRAESSGGSCAASAQPSRASSELITDAPRRRLLGGGRPALARAIARQPADQPARHLAQGRRRAPVRAMRWGPVGGARLQRGMGVRPRRVGRRDGGCGASCGRRGSAQRLGAGAEHTSRLLSLEAALSVAEVDLQGAVEARRALRHGVCVEARYPSLLQRSRGAQQRVGIQCGARSAPAQPHGDKAEGSRDRSRPSHQRGGLTCRARSPKISSDLDCLQAPASWD